MNRSNTHATSHRSDSHEEALTIHRKLRQPPTATSDCVKHVKFARAQNLERLRAPRKVSRQTSDKCPFFSLSFLQFDRTFDRGQDPVHATGELQAARGPEQTRFIYVYTGRRYRHLVNQEEVVPFPCVHAVIKRAYTRQCRRARVIKQY